MTSPTPCTVMRAWHGPLWLLLVGIAVLPAAVSVGGLARNFYLINALVLLALVVITAGLYLRSRPGPVAVGGPTPIGYAPDGRPVFQVVGYTVDGTSITADQAPGYRPFNPRTNTMAVLALVMCFFFFPAAIVLGHMARKEISQTGEQGDGMAVAGLIVGYAVTVFMVSALAFQLVVFIARPGA